VRRVQALLDQSLATDGRSQSQRVERLQVRDRMHATGGLPRDLREAALRLPVEFGVRPGQRSIASDVRAEYVAQSGRQERSDGIPQGQAGISRPAAGLETGHTRLVQPHIECEPDAFRAEMSQPLTYLIGGLDGGAANDHPIDTVGQQIIDRGALSNPAAHLQQHRRLRCQGHHGAAIGNLSAARAVQIDDVQPARPHVPVAQHQLVWRKVIARFAIKIALQQAHTAPAANIDRWNEFHGQSLRKFASRRAPTGPDRSGWNCTPRKLARPTTAAKPPL
jgi:hypothetical protein